MVFLSIMFHHKSVSQSFVVGVCLFFTCFFLMHFTLKYVYFVSFCFLYYLIMWCIVPSYSVIIMVNTSCTFHSILKIHFISLFQSLNSNLAVVVFSFNSHFVYVLFCVFFFFAKPHFIVNLKTFFWINCARHSPRQQEQVHVNFFFYNEKNAKRK